MTTKNQILGKGTLQQLVVWVVLEEGGQDESDVVVKVCASEQDAKDWIADNYGPRQRWFTDIERHEVYTHNREVHRDKQSEAE